jgi:hypothetical protein
MTPTASPRHPWKALAVVLAMFAVVHGARAHISSHEHGFTHIHVGDAWSSDRDCPDIDVVDDEDEADEGPDDGLVIDLFDGEDWA